MLVKVTAESLITKPGSPAPSPKIVANLAATAFARVFSSAVKASVSIVTLPLTITLGSSSPLQSKFQHIQE